MGKQRAGRIEFLPVQKHLSIPLNNLGLEVDRRLGADFGKGIAQPVAIQNTGEIWPLLLFRSRQTQGLDLVEMVLRDLADGGIGAEMIAVTSASVAPETPAPPYSFGMVIRPKARLRESLDFRKRQTPLPVAATAPSANSRARTLAVAMASASSAIRCAGWRRGGPHACRAPCHQGRLTVQFAVIAAHEWPQFHA